MRISEKKLESIKVMVQEGKYLEEISVELSLPVSVINKYIKQGFKPYEVKHRVYHKEMKHDYFASIDTEEQAYFLGVLLGAGSLKGNFLRVRVIEERKELLERLCKVINLDCQIKEITTKDGLLLFCIEVKSSRLSDTLYNYGMSFSKNKLRALPKIPHALLSTFLLGLFDSIGTITYENFYRKPGEKSDGKMVERYSFSFIANSFFCKSIFEWVKESTEVKLNMIQKKNTKDLVELQVNRNNDFAAFASYLYSSPNAFDLANKETLVLFHDAYEFYNR